MKNAAYVYGLHAGDGDFRYIGKSVLMPRQRLAAHICDAKGRRAKLERSVWICSLLNQGMKPQMRVFEICERNLGAERERAYIALFKGLGNRLTNLTDGGDGAPGCNPSAETRARLSAALVGRIHSPETRAKIAASHMGILNSPETRAKISAALKGRSGTWIGRKHSPESRAKMSLARIGNKNSLGRTDMRGRKHSSEAIENMRAGMLRAWAKRKARA